MTGLQLHSHANILQNELIQLNTRASIGKATIDARGGVVAGAINITDSEVRCKSFYSVSTV